jgi:hypothetical protein
VLAKSGIVSSLLRLATVRKCGFKIPIFRWLTRVFRSSPVVLSEQDLERVHLLKLQLVSLSGRDSIEGRVHFLLTVVVTAMVMVFAAVVAVTVCHYSVVVVLSYIYHCCNM